MARKEAQDGNDIWYNEEALKFDKRGSSFVCRRQEKRSFYRLDRKTHARWLNEP